MGGVEIRVADLPAGVLGLAALHSQLILVDVDADGQGWFIDATPGADEEFAADIGGQLVAASWSSRGGVDLLTVLAHELGHLLGHADDYDASELNLMEFALPPGVRRLPLSAAGIWSGETAVAENLDSLVLWAPADDVRVFRTGATGTWRERERMRV